MKCFSSGFVKDLMHKHKQKLSAACCLKTKVFTKEIRGMVAFDVKLTSTDNLD